MNISYLYQSHPIHIYHCIVVLSSLLLQWCVVVVEVGVVGVGVVVVGEEGNVGRSRIGDMLSLMEEVNNPNKEIQLSKEYQENHV